MFGLTIGYGLFFSLLIVCVVMIAINDKTGDE